MPPPATSSATMEVGDRTGLDSNVSASPQPSDMDTIDMLSKRMAIDVVMKLPVLVIPISSKSTVALVVDLGGLSVANELAVVPEVSSVENLPAVIDRINCHWSSINIARYVLELERSTKNWTRPIQ